MIKWCAPSYEGDRRVALVGIVEVGAVFPPDSNGKWRWRMWLTSSVLAKEGKAVTELAAKTDLDRAFASFLVCANLVEAA